MKWRWPETSSAACCRRRAAGAAGLRHRRENEPCFEVGGDYYDFLPLGPESLLVVIADVEGKGISSAMVMSNLQATFARSVLHPHSLNRPLAESVNHMILAGYARRKIYHHVPGAHRYPAETLTTLTAGTFPRSVVRTEGCPSA